MLRSGDHADPFDGDPDSDFDAMHSDDDWYAGNRNCYLDAGHAYSDRNPWHGDPNPRHTDRDGHTMRCGCRQLRWRRRPSLVMGVSGTNGSDYGSILIAGLLIGGSTLVGRRFGRGDRTR